MDLKYYQSSTGKSPVEVFEKTLPKEIKEDYLSAIDRLEKGENLSMPLSKPLPQIHKGLHELRFKDGTGKFRFFYYIKKKDAIYMLHAVKLKRWDIPKKEKEIILKRIKEI